MLFNSDVFLKFFAAFLLVYFLVRNHLRLRNVFIVGASYLFYGWWDYRFLSLLLISSLLDYFVGIGLARLQDHRRRKLLLSLSLIGNLSLLGFFKYYDFFAESLAALLARLQAPIQVRTLGIILPIGISFYTFQTMSYAIDVYRRELAPTRKLVDFLAYVSFFPQLVAGPIERARHLLPQFGQTREITAAMLEEGIWLLIWGMFKKVALADNLAPLVEMVFGHSGVSGPMVALGTLAFGFQIYCDFSGYSDIARGTARLLGFDIMVNFNLPYAATTLRDFWRRWHISFSTWLRDYLYLSLGGNRRGAGRTALNILATMVLGGLWHGAAWNFVVWGLWHAGGLIGQRAIASGSQVGGSKFKVRNSKFEVQSLASGTDFSANIGKGLSWLATMLFVFYGWLLFRAGSMERIVSMTLAFGNLSVPLWWRSYVINLAVFTLPLAMMEIWQAKSQNLLAPLTLPAWAKAALQGALLFGILLFWEKEKVPFIYFQF